MVKNLGGNKSKGFARKNLVKREHALRVATEEGEIYAQAVKVMGGSIASAIDIDGNPLRAHIRGKFRGRGKRDNFIGPGTWLLVGLHSWEGDKTSKTSEMRNCDILEVYSDADKNRLKSSVTSVNWSRFVLNDNKTLKDDDPTNSCADIEFTEDNPDDYIKTDMTMPITNSVIMDDGDVIDVDDI